MRDALENRGGYDTNKTKAVMTVNGTTPCLTILDPEMASQIYTKLNHKIDKTGRTQLIFYDLLGNGFVFSKGNQKC